MKTIKTPMPPGHVDSVTPTPDERKDISFLSKQLAALVLQHMKLDGEPAGLVDFINQMVEDTVEIVKAESNSRGWGVKPPPDPSAEPYRPGVDPCPDCGEVHQKRKPLTARLFEHVNKSDAGGQFAPIGDDWE